MTGFLLRMPLLVLLVGLAAVLMLAPAGFASVTGYAAIARNFFYAALLTLTFCGLIGLAAQANPRGQTAREMLLLMLGSGWALGHGVWDRVAAFCATL